MRLLLVAVSVIFVGSAAAAENTISASRSSSNQTYAPGDIIFQDEFDYLNTGLWNYEVNMNGGGNNEFQIYDRYPENAYVREGVLYMRPTLALDTIFNGNYELQYNGHLRLDGCTDAGGGSGCERQGNYPYILPPTVSTRLRTAGSFSFTYGRVEIRARMPVGDWMWPAIWMLPEEWRYGGWPASGEIDIVESRGNRRLYNPSGVNIGSEQVGSTLHFGPYWPHDAWWAGHGNVNSAPDQGFERDFHIYKVDWYPDHIKFMVDDREIRTIRPGNGGFWELGQFPGDISSPWTNAPNPRMAPFDQNFHLILNVAVGGEYFPPDSSPGRPWGSQTSFLDFFLSQDQWISTWRQGENSAMAVDYIRIYAV